MYIYEEFKNRKLHKTHVVLKYTYPKYIVILLRYSNSISLVIFYVHKNIKIRSLRIRISSRIFSKKKYTLILEKCKPIENDHL